MKPPHARRDPRYRPPEEPPPETLARDLIAGAIGIGLLFLFLFVLLPFILGVA